FSSSSFLLTLRPTRSTRFPYTTLFPIYEGIAIAEGVEDLTVDARGGVAGQEHRKGGDVVRVALGTHRLLARPLARLLEDLAASRDRKSTRLNSSHQIISYAVFCLKKKNN